MGRVENWYLTMVFSRELLCNTEQSPAGFESGYATGKAHYLLTHICTWMKFIVPLPDCDDPGGIMPVASEEKFNL